MISILLLVALACSIPGLGGSGKPDEAGSNSSGGVSAGKEEGKPKPESAKPEAAKPEAGQQPGKPEGANPSDGAAAKQESVFPMPDDAKVMTSDDKMAIYQTAMDLKAVMAFYRDVFAKEGLKERKNLEAVTDETFSIVFTGAKNGMDIVVQGSVFGSTSNISIRYEKVN